MPAQVFPDVLDCEVEVAEIVPGVAPADWPHYPFPPVRGSGKLSPQSLRTVVLENELLRVTVAIDLGGRILEVLDKRTGTELLPKTKELIWAGIPQIGVQWSLGEGIRPTATAPMHVAMDEPSEEEDAAQVQLFELIPGLNLSLQVTLRLAPEEAVVDWEMRIHNRGFRSIQLSPGLKFPGAKPYDEGRRAGFVVVDAEAAFDRPTERDQVLGPREVSVQRARLVAVSGLAHLTSAAEVGALCVQLEGMAVQFTWPPETPTVHLESASGEHFQSPLELNQTLTARIPLAGELSNPARVRVIDGDQVLLEGNAQIRQPETNRDAPLAPEVAVPADGIELLQATRNALTRGAAHARLGQLHAQKSAWPQAAESFEAALMYNGDDPLTWALRAYCDRHLHPEEDSQARLNAHYLCPAEPFLRADAFLSQNVSLPEPHPLVAPLADDPHMLVDVAVQLLELGQLAEAGRWIDEALRHRSVGLLQLLKAHLLIHHSRMQMEGDALLAELEPSPIEPPYPWHETVVAAIAQLAESRPQSARLARLAKREF